MEFVLLVALVPPGYPGAHTHEVVGAAARSATEREPYSCDVGGGGRPAVVLLLGRQR